MSRQFIAIKINAFKLLNWSTFTAQLSDRHCARNPHEMVKLIIQRALGIAHFSDNGWAKWAVNAVMPPEPIDDAWQYKPFQPMIPNLLPCIKWCEHELGEKNLVPWAKFLGS